MILNYILTKIKRYTKIRNYIRMILIVLLKIMEILYKIMRKIYKRVNHISKKMREFHNNKKY